MAVTVASLQAVLDLDKRGFDRGLKTSETMLNRLANVGVQKGINALESGLRTMGDAVVDSVRQSADLEAQLSAVGAVSGATADEIADIKGLVKDLGIDPNLKVSSFEAADAIEMLARNGLDLQQVMDGAARSTVLLANSTGGEFSQAADIATDSMTLFNIAAKDMDQAVNGITSVVTNSKFDVNDYALALAQAGGVAAASGVEFDDFNTAIAGIAPLFASGSDAGTSLKVMLQKLSNPTKKARGLMEELGIAGLDTTRMFELLEENGLEPANDSIHAAHQEIIGLFNTLHSDLVPGTEEHTQALGEWQRELGVINDGFFDANGNLKDMAEIADILNSSLGDLSEEQRNQALSTIFGTDAMRAAVGLMELGADGFTELQGSMSQTDAAEAAAQRMDNLAGSMEILDGVIETIKLQIGDGLNPAVRAGAEDLTEFLSKAQEAGTPTAELGASIQDNLLQPTRDLAEAMGLLGEDMSTVDAVMASIQSVADTWGPSLQMAGAGISTMALIIGGAKDIFSFFDGQLDSIGIKIDIFSEGVKFAQDAILGILFPLTRVVEAFSQIKEAISIVTDAWPGFVETMSTKIDLPDWLIPGSPTPFELGLRGISSAINDMPDLDQAVTVPAGGGTTNNFNFGGFAANVTTQGDGGGEQAIQMVLQMLRSELSQ